MTMFCNQCQEAMNNVGCTVQGMCGKKAATANLQDQLIRQLKVLCTACNANRELGHFVIRALFTTLTNTNFDDARFQQQIDKIDEFLAGKDVSKIVPVDLSTVPADVRSLQELLTYGLKGISAYAVHAEVLGFEEDAIYAFIFKALRAQTKEMDAKELLAMVLESGQISVTVMKLLDEANTSTFGKPEMTTVRTGVGNRPGILISGHDLMDLKDLLEQTKDAGIDIYTHGEMLPAHSYPELKKYPQLVANYGNAWYKQRTEFASFNGPILMTTNCIVPVADAYKDRIFTTGEAGWPDVPFIEDRPEGGQKDFSKIIEMAKKCPPPTALEDGEVTGGFAHDQVLALADKVIAAVKSGAIRKFIVMAGCDGRHKTRDYYTQVAQNLPKDTIILTAGCAKYRFIKEKLGDIGGIPRVLDAGQCNDCYSLVVIAMALKDAFGLDDVNDLPLAFDISWYEQKAVTVLLALLALGFKKIRLGPTLPAFLSPGITKVLVDSFGICGINTPAEDIADMMK